MIRRLKGRVVERQPGSIVLDVHDVGYHVIVAKRARALPGDELALSIYTHVREDALQLYGFESDAEREVFELLLGVPSVGPVKAIGILGTPIDELTRLIDAEEVTQLSKLPGIGKKTAERLVLDLRGKLAAPAPVEGRAPVKTARVLNDLVSALQNLGFKPKVAEEMAKKAVERHGLDAELELLIRDVLSHTQSR